jgi:hypothetical protein
LPTGGPVVQHTYARESPCGIVPTWGEDAEGDWYTGAFWFIWIGWVNRVPSAWRAQRTVPSAVVTDSCGSPT